ncbi:MAG TPA: J domain-containing protein [Candidatus Limnocylindria bacterium]|nr:J domain-containing protein [Candidatus Limnocylindria bacterium]
MPDRPPFDPYAVLGVERDATHLQVARAHRRLAKRYHPDVHPEPDGAARMRRINEAWQILSDRTRRSAYDTAHPAAGTAVGVPSGGHWAGSRRPVRTSPPTTTRTWASWRATADETRAAPRTTRAPGEVPIPVTRRPVRPDSGPATFRDSGLAAVLVAAVLVALLLTAIVAGKLGSV